MFISKIAGKESIAEKASAMGLKAGEAMKGRSCYGLPALGGNTFSHKEAIKAAGARWDGENKVWAFESWAALEAAIDSIAQ